jgi:hypothetical protein
MPQRLSLCQQVLLIAATLRDHVTCFPQSQALPAMLLRKQEPVEAVLDLRQLSQLAVLQQCLAW